MKIAPPGKEQFIVDATGQRVGVVLDLPTYKRLREAAEDNADLRAYRAAKSRAAAEIAQGEFATLEEYRARRSRRRR